MRRHEEPGTADPAMAPDALRPPPGNPRFPLVDGLRAFAALSVLVTHTAFLSGFNGHGFLGAVTARLDVGVTLFFVISGFLLYRPFVAARREGRPRPHVRRYFRRRALRIVPAYWLALTVLAIWPGLVGVHTGDWWGYYGFLQNLSVDWIGGGITAAWSLCVEMQFYLALPLLALFADRWLAGPKDELMALGGLALASLAVRWATHADPSPDVWSNTIAGTFGWFALGMAIAVVSVQWHHVPVARRPVVLRAVVPWPLAWWGLSAQLMILTTQIGMPTTYPQVYDDVDWILGFALYGAMAVAFAVPAMLGDGRGVPATVLRWRPVAWLGLVSYGIFLWHHPLTGELREVQDWTSHGSFVVYTLAVFVAATACAAASYYLVERPLLRFKNPRPPASKASGSAGPAPVPAPGRARRPRRRPRADGRATARPRSRGARARGRRPPGPALPRARRRRRAAAPRCR
ncbi:MAG: acyltransferase [Solirubrobacterales bacterium]|nr:acyltransferase [Solirubrobacterales bacterium]